VPLRKSDGGGACTGIEPGQGLARRNYTYYYTQQLHYPPRRQADRVTRRGATDVVALVCGLYRW
jgi:hypothetical protein